MNFLRAAQTSYVQHTLSTCITSILLANLTSYLQHTLLSCRSHFLLASFTSYLQHTLLTCRSHFLLASHTSYLYFTYHFMMAYLSLYAIQVRMMDTRGAYWPAPSLRHTSPAPWSPSTSYSGRRQRDTGNQAHCYRTY